ncbi:ubiquitin family protein [Besnoitia besnoiti]|uniref:Ubiquitin family protein n=1 Tax=Besnoitia besnoiti TaxID=94643 RepID=A0A2A9MJ81_BESBE|nr:ubiquitin family protein [Besnoitia besnoiti]PFH36026.1 ubiquitin family protein [Besnoitia besnoiti]
MQISIAVDETGVVFSLEVSNSTSLEDLRALIEAESQIPVSEQRLLLDMKPVSASAATVAAAGIPDGSMLLVLRRASSSAASTGAGPVAAGPVAAGSVAAGSGSTGAVVPPVSAPSSRRDRAGAGGRAANLQSLFDFSNIVVKDGRATTNARPREAAGATSSSRAVSRRTEAQPAQAAAGAPSSGETGDRDRPPMSDEEYLRQQAQTLINVCSAQEATLGVLALENPPLGACLREAVKEAKEGLGGKEKFDKLVEHLKKQLEERRKAEEARLQQLNSALSDPLSASVQEFMMEQIREKQVEDNYLLAQEHLPEAFGSVYMLFIDIEVNGVPIKAFVDSGAQSTFMSYACAEKCSLLRLMDTRYRGVAQGVGKTEIVGKIHLATLKLGQRFFPSSFTVLQDNKVEFLFGLDLLRRYQCCIDLKKNVLRIDDDEVPFLSEKDITKGMFGRADTPTNLGSPTAGESGEERKEGDAAAPAPSQAPARQSSTTSLAPEDEAKVQQLVDLGFLRTDAVDALAQAGGNVEAAAAFLFHQQQAVQGSLS